MLDSQLRSTDLYSRQTHRQLYALFYTSITQLMSPLLLLTKLLRPSRIKGTIHHPHPLVLLEAYGAAFRRGFFYFQTCFTHVDLTVAPAHFHWRSTFLLWRLFPPEITSLVLATCLAADEASAKTIYLPIVSDQDRPFLG